MTDRELMQQALDAATEELPKVDERETVFCSIQGHHLRALCEFVRAALTQPEPEPVAWLYEGSDVAGRDVCLAEDIFEEQKPHCKPLYTAPPQREFIGLTDEEIREFEIWLDDEEEKHGWNSPADIVKYIEAKLKDR